MSTKEDRTKQETVFDQVLLAALCAAVRPVLPHPKTAARMRSRLLSKIQMNQFHTIRADQGTWIMVAPGIAKKQLKVDRDTKIESFLLRVEPGAETPPHTHDQGDELCLVLQGEVYFGETQLKTGDYHLAKKGSRHARSWCENGALLFMQAPLAEG